jgi:hypothetical protein
LPDFYTPFDGTSPGCLVTKLNLGMKTENGNTDQTMEIWKDIRGCVPVQRTYVNGRLQVEEIAQKWTGNTLIQKDWDGPLKR